MSRSRNLRPTRWARIAVGMVLPLLAGWILLCATPSQAQARIVNINAKASGCTNSAGACDNAADHMPPGSLVRLIAPVTLTLAAGTYRISYAGAQGRYAGWRINAEPKWVWNFGIAVNTGGRSGKLLYVAIVRGIYNSVADLTRSRAAVVAGAGGPNAKLPVVVKLGGPTAYADTLKLPSAARLSFFVLDYYGADNAGGVSLKIEPLAPAR